MEQTDNLEKALYNNETSDKIFMHDDSSRVVEFVVGDKAKELKYKLNFINKNINIINDDIFTVRTKDKLLICTEKDIFELDGVDLFSTVTCKEIKFNNTMLGKSNFISGWFQYSIIDTIDLSEIDLTNATHSQYTFYEASVNNIIIENKDLRKMKFISKMFYKTQSSNVILRNLKLDEIDNARDAFMYAKINNLILDNIQLDKIHYVYNIFENFRGRITFNNIKKVGLGI